MRFKKLLFKFFSAICLCMITGIFLLFLTLRFVTYTPEIYVESTSELQNPYIGWYQIYNYNLSGDEFYNLSEIRSQEHHAGLVLLEFNLQSYAASPISENGLLLLDHLLSSWKSTGRQLIIRFSYNWNGNALESEPQDLSLILTHMSQTSEIINQYADCIYILQGIFIGPWGEMHSSRYANNEDMVTLTSHLASVINPNIFLAVRTPQQWRLLTDSAEPVYQSDAFSGSLASRLSLFNDGMLGSNTDLNTYAATPAPGFPSCYEKGSRQEEITFQNRLCFYVPNGGEVVVPNSYNDFSSAVKDLKGTHISYLNQDYDEAVFSKWRTEFCTEDSSYHGLNGYDYISRHLGYRYVLRSSECSSIFPWHKTAELSITLQNVGFSNCYRPFDVSLTLEETSTNRTFSLPVKTDTRFWNPEDTIRLTCPVNIQEYATGTYDIFLKISDPGSDCQILFANEGTYNEKGHLLGCLDIHIFPK